MKQKRKIKPSFVRTAAEIDQLVVGLRNKDLQAKEKASNFLRCLADHIDSDSQCEMLELVFASMADWLTKGD